jgi:hypothetical protein
MGKKIDPGEAGSIPFTAPSSVINTMGAKYNNPITCEMVIGSGQKPYQH